MASHSSVVIRDKSGRYLKGMQGGPGRPIGSRNKLTEHFLADLHRFIARFQKLEGDLED
jgi:hypothetical protein